VIDAWATTPPGGVETGEGGKRLDRMSSHAGTFFSLRGFSGPLPVGSGALDARERAVGDETAAKGLRLASRASAHRIAADMPVAVPFSAARRRLAPAPLSFPIASVCS